MTQWYQNSVVRQPYQYPRTLIALIHMVALQAHSSLLVITDRSKLLIVKGIIIVKMLVYRYKIGSSKIVRF